MKKAIIGLLLLVFLVFGIVDIFDQYQNFGVIGVVTSLIPLTCISLLYGLLASSYTISYVLALIFTFIASAIYNFDAEILYYASVLCFSLAYGGYAFTLLQQIKLSRESLIKIIVGVCGILLIPIFFLSKVVSGFNLFILYMFGVSIMFYFRLSVIIFAETNNDITNALLIAGLGVIFSTFLAASAKFIIDFNELEVIGVVFYWTTHLLMCVFMVGRSHNFTRISDFKALLKS